MKLVPKRRFKGFAGEWQDYKLGNVLEGMYNGQTPSRFNPTYWNGNINWLSSGELNRGVVSGTKEKITVAGQRSANLRIVPKDTFVMAITGLEAVGTRGNCGQLGIDSTLNQSCMALFPKSKILDSDFLFQWYRKIGNVYGIKYTQGTKQQSYNAMLIQNLPITMPRVKEQQKIGIFFNLIDKMINNARCNLQKLRTMKQAYLHEMFPAEGESVPKRRFAGFKHPWKQQKLDDLGTTYSGLSGKTKEDFGKGNAEFVPYLNVFNNPISDINFTEPVKIDQSQNEVMFGDIFFTTSSETPEEVGLSSMWLDDRENVYLNSFCFGYRPRENVDPHYMAYVLRTAPVRNQFILLAQGISRYNISSRKAMQIQISFPKLEEQRLIGHFFSQLDKRIAIQQAKVEKLMAMKQAYLDEMFV